MTEQIIERHENPHVERPDQPLLIPHAFRPSSLVAGGALTAMGAVFLAHQLGAISLGPIPTIFLAVIVVAAGLIGIAFSWARRDGGPPTAVDGAVADPDKAS